MKTYSEVYALIKQWKQDGLSKSQIVVNTANECIGWPYVYAGRGEECTPANRKERAGNDHPDIISKCQVLNRSSGSCSGCKWYPNGVVLFFDCRGFTYWLLMQVGIKISGQGATSQWNNDDNWTEKGRIDDMPKDKVCCVFRHDDASGKMEHTLLYDGQGNYIHCSGEVKKVPVSKYKATHYAIPKGLEGGVEPVPTPSKTAIVYAENGKPVKMRQKPSTSCKTYWEIKCGTEVTVLQEGSEWTKISWDDHTGYMMSQFLKSDDGIKDEGPAPSMDLCVCHIPNITKAEADELMKKYPDAWVSVG